MTRAGGTGSAPPGAPCSHAPLREQRGDRTGFVASEEVRTLPEVSLPSFSTPPAPASGHPRSRRGVGAAQPRQRLPPACLPGASTESARSVAKEQSHQTGTRCPSPPCTAGEPQRARGVLCAGETEAARQPRLGVGRVQRHFCPPADFPCGEDPCGAGQKEFRRKLGAGSRRRAARQDGRGGAGRSRERCGSRAGLAGRPRGQPRRHGQLGS